MKKISKILALAMMLALVLSMGVVAWAEGETQSVITINRDDSWDASAENANATYTWYKIFDAEITEAADVNESTGASGDGVVVYTISGEDAADKVAVLPDIFTAKLAADGKYYITLTDTETTAAAIVDALKTMVEENTTLFPGTDVTSNANPVVINVPSDGYYLIVASNGKDLAVQTIGNVTIKEKNDYPTVDKKQSETTSAYADDELNVEVGSYINYQITVHIPADATKAIVVADVMSAGLQYDSTTGLTLNPNIAYTQLTSEDAEYNAGADWQIKFAESVVADNLGQDVVITYRALVTAAALTDTARNNEVTLTYDNGNYVLKDNTTYTTYFGGIEKVDGQDDTIKLEGVKFTVTVGEEDFNVTPVTKGGDGEDKDEVLYYIPGGDSNEVVTGKDGLIIIRGLDSEKTYTLTEIETNAGYNLLETPKDLTLEEDTGDAFETKDNYDQILNNKGAQLPSTGGIGTTIFYVVGSILVVVAGVLLVVKKRMGADK